MKFFQKFERRFGRYAIHNLMYYIIMFYIMGFVIMYTAPQFFNRYLSLDAEAILHGQVWRLVTFLMYPPTSSPIWIIFAILMYYSLGRSLEAVWGAFRFNVFFFMGVAGIILAEFIVYFLFGWEMHLNTTYLNLTIFLAYAVIFPDEWFYIYFIIAIKAKWLALFDAFFLIMGFVYGGLAQKIAIFLALANFIIFFLMTKDFKKYSPREVKRKQDFKTQMRPVSRARHRCAVCGRTDEESPGMEFRYCSKCEGSYEYCMDHLYTHQHVKKSDSPK
ncbi:MAG: hypothetical protein ACI4F3_08785 [Enterocloster sp.]